MKIILFFITIFLSVLGLEYLFTEDLNEVNYSSLVVILIILSLLFSLSLFINGSVKYCRSYTLNTLLDEVYDIKALERKIDQYVNSNEFILLNKEVADDKLYYEIKVPMSLWSWGNKLIINLCNKNLLISAINTSFIQQIDLQLTNKILVENLISSVRRN
ncbi:MAG: hypothetical protein IPM92_02920 [Saprospiraceae bacterium]|nr:hypothetical protein [Saprospiraceae bacterium]